MKKKLFFVSMIVAALSILLYIFQFQEPIDSFIYNHFIFNETFTAFFKTITIFANFSMILVILLCILTYSKKKKRVREGVQFLIFSAFSFGFMEILKFLFQRERPTIRQLIDIAGFSFPSGHAFFSILIYGYVLYLVNMETKGKKRHLYNILLVSLIILIGISRIYLGVHYTTDILFGYSLGFMSLMFFIDFIHRDGTREKR